MPTYVYETIPKTPGARVEQFEVQQSMKDAPMTQHPENGLPVRRVISGGYGFSGSSKKSASSGHSCGHGCGCN